MRNKRCDTAHIRLKLFNKFQFLCKRMRRLMRTSHHKAAADPKADIFQISKAVHSVVKGHFPRMQSFIVLPIRSHVIQRIMICPRKIHLLIFTADMFSKGKHYGTIGIYPMYIRYNITDCICRNCSHAPLQHKGS